MFQCQDELDAEWVSQHPDAAAALEDMLEAFEQNMGRFPGTSEMAGIVKLCREQHDPWKLLWMRLWTFAFLGMLTFHFAKCGSDIVETLQ